MKNLFLTLIMLAVAAFGYGVMRKLDRFIEENQRRIAVENRKGKCQVRLAAENPMLLEAAASALESCSRAEPHIEFFLSSGKADHLLQKLLEGQADILLLTEENAQALDPSCESVRIPCGNNKSGARVLGLPVENLETEAWMYVVWKKDRSSKDRDRVIFALENEHCRQECGSVRDSD